MESLIFFLVALVFAAAIGLFVYEYYAKRKRRDQMASVARTHGFNYAPDDPLSLLNCGLPLLGLGDDRGIENTVWGDFKGLPINAADYWFYTESTDDHGATDRTYHRFSVAVTTVAAYLPDLSVEPENVFTRLADHLGLHDIDFESGGFNDRFQVKASHRKFAFDFIDARVMRWLLSIDSRYSLQTRGDKIMLYSKRLSPDELFLLIGTTKEMFDRVPSLVWEEYGSGRPPGEEEARTS